MKELNKQILQPHQVQALLARFYDGLTTGDDEQQLRQYFEQADVPTELETDRQVFQVLTAERRRASAHAVELYPDALDSKLNALMARFADEETPAPPRSLIHRWSLWVEVAAACFAAVIVLQSLHYDKPPTAIFRIADTCQTPEEAAVYLHQALALMSTHLQDGVGQLNVAVERNLQAQQEALKNVRFNY